MNAPHSGEVLEAVALGVGVGLGGDTAAVVERGSACELAHSIGIRTHGQRAAGVLVPATPGRRGYAMMNGGHLTSESHPRKSNLPIGAIHQLVIPDGNQLRRKSL